MFESIREVVPKTGQVKKDKICYSENKWVGKIKGEAQVTRETSPLIYRRNNNCSKPQTGFAQSITNWFNGNSSKFKTN